jgi:hypothetical protein
VTIDEIMRDVTSGRAFVPAAGKAWVATAA